MSVNEQEKASIKQLAKDYCLDFNVVKDIYRRLPIQDVYAELEGLLQERMHKI